MSNFFRPSFNKTEDSMMKLQACTVMTLTIKTLLSVSKLTTQRTSGFASSAKTFCRKSRPASNTIFALSSGHGRCGVAVIRVSGPSCSEAVKSLCAQERLPPPRRAVLKRLFDPASREMIDKGLVLWFPGPSSFTGEDCAEFQVHGGTAVVAAMLDALGTVPGLRPAEPGDFTRRAFLNGKMDLTAVEGLGDLIHAETAAQRRQAVRQMEGDLANLYADWRHRILKCLANVEAFIDFSEDENIEEDTIERATAEVERVCRELQRHLSDNRQGERLREGVRVAIIGEPNVGKSSLLNALCQRPAAIVSPQAGTTRDVVETAINLAGYPVLLSDTAGLRETSDVVEKEGVRRALDRASKADLKVLVLDASTALPARPSNVPWARFVFSHMASLGVGKSSDVKWGEQELLQGGSLRRPLSAAPTASAGLATPANDGQHRGVVTSHSHTSPGALNSTPATDGQHRGVVTSHSHTSPGALNSKMCTSDAEHLVVATQMDKSRIPASEGESEQGMYVSENMHDSRLLNSKNAKQSGMTDLDHVLDPEVPVSDDVIVVVNKSDLVPADSDWLLLTREDLGVDVCLLSCTTAKGLDSFVSLLADRVKRLCGDPLAGSPSLTQSRHRTHLTQCLHHLSAYLSQVRQCDSVLAAQALRRAMRELGRVTGAVNVEDVLDVIFKDFCIGK